MDQTKGIKSGAENTDSSAAQGSTEPSEENKETKSAATNMNRYVMIRVEYDQALVGPKPTEPIPPEQPDMPEEIKQGHSFNSNASDLPPVPVGVARVSPLDHIRQEYSNAVMTFQTALQQYQSEKRNTNRTSRNTMSDLKMAKRKLPS